MLLLCVFMLFAYLTNLTAQVNIENYPIDCKTPTKIFKDSKGNLWFHNNYRFGKGPLVMYDGSKFETFKKIEGASTAFVMAIVEDKDNNIWVSTYVGLLRYDGKTWKRYTTKDGLPSNVVGNLYIAQDNNLWVFCAKGLFRGAACVFDKDKFIEQKDIPINKFIINAFEDKNNDLWLGGHLAGLVKFDGKTWEDHSNKIPFKHVVCIIEDQDDKFWISSIEGKFAKQTDGGWEKYYIKGGYFFGPAAAPMFILGLLPGIIMGYAAPNIISESEMLLDNENRVWCLTRQGGVAIYNGKSFDNPEVTLNAPKLKSAWSIMKDTKGNIWITLQKKGLVKYDGTNWKHYTKKDGLPKIVYSMIELENGNIWLGGKKSAAILKK